VDVRALEYVRDQKAKHVFYAMRKDPKIAAPFIRDVTRYTKHYKFLFPLLTTEQQETIIVKNKGFKRCFEYIQSPTDEQYARALRLIGLYIIPMNKREVILQLQLDKEANLNNFDYVRDYSYLPLLWKISMAEKALDTNFDKLYKYIPEESRTVKLLIPYVDHTIYSRWWGMPQIVRDVYMKHHPDVILPIRPSCEYIYLDVEERKRFTQCCYTQLLEELNLK
jgi:hypothetical protein